MCIHSNTHDIVACMVPQSRPDAPSMEAYSRVKPEDFGIGSLLGMGWKEGDPIGLTNRRYALAIG